MLLKSKLEYEKQFNKIKNKPKRKKVKKSSKQRKSKFLDRYGNRIESIRNTENVKRKNREQLRMEQQKRNDEQAEFIENVLEKIQKDKDKNNK